jgi:hypothetical protein
VVVAEVTPANGRGGADESVISVLRGRVEIAQLDPASGRPLGAPMRLDALQSLAFKGTQVPQFRTLSPEVARRLASQYRIPLGQTPSPIQAAIADSQRDTAIKQVDALLQGKGAAAVAPTATIGALGGSGGTTGDTTAGTLNTAVSPSLSTTNTTSVTGTLGTTSTFTSTGTLGTTSTFTSTGTFGTTSTFTLGTTSTFTSPVSTQLTTTTKIVPTTTIVPTTNLLKTTSGTSSGTSGGGISGGPH